MTNYSVALMSSINEFLHFITLVIFGKDTGKVNTFSFPEVIRELHSSFVDCM